MGNMESKFPCDSKGNDQSSLKGMMKDSRTVDRSKVPQKIKGKAKARKRKPTVPQRTSSLKSDEGVGMQGHKSCDKELDITCLPHSRIDGNSETADQNLEKEHDEQIEDFEIKREPKLMIAAIDFGTTYSGYAFSFPHDHMGDEANPDKIYVSNWENEGGSGMYAKTPTCLLLDPGGNLHSFGSAAMEKYSSLSDDDEHHEWYFFWQFKMILHQEEEIRADTIITEENGKTLEAIKVFQCSIQYLKDRLMGLVKKSFRDSIEETDIRWVITVPAIWNDSAKKLMRQAAEKAGIKKDLIEIALEPESASIYCRTVNFCRTEPGSSRLGTFPLETRYLVLDCGGKVNRKAMTRN